MTQRTLQSVLLLAVVLGASTLFAQAPPLALSVPSKCTRCIDGDTLEMDVTFKLRVRLMDIEAPEMRGGTLEERDAARASLANLEKVALNQPCTLYVPLVGRPTLGHLFSFERLVGKVFVYGEDLGERQIADGHARRAGK